MDRQDSARPRAETTRKGPSPDDPAGPDPTLAERLAFLELSDQDAGRVRAMASMFGSYLDDFTDRFYEHLFANPTTAAYLADPELVKRLKQTQQRYFESMLEAELDADYVRDRLRIGRAHAEAGLEPQWFLGAYNQYIQFCFRRFAAHCDGGLNDYVEGTLSLLKVILLDMGLALDSYFSRATDELRKALRLLAQSNAELKEFARLASHDLKTPLATVAGYCEEFLDEFGGEVSDEGRGLIEAARAKTLQLGRTVDELLSISMAGAQPDHRSRVPARRLFEGALERLHSELDAGKGRVVLPDEMPEVFVHAGRVQEVFFNLISNALKYNDKGNSVVKVGVSEAEGMHVFRVIDNGPGIAEADYDKIFAPFRRLPQHKGKPGSGLGLYFVKTIVEEQGGRVWVESKVGEGTCFFVALPTVDSNAGKGAK